MLEKHKVHDVAFLYAFLAGVLDIGANLASTQSKGFTKPAWGILSILLVLCAFRFLAEATKVIDLPVAYAVLGATGIFGTAICGRFIFGNRLKPTNWIGFALVFAAVVVLQSEGHEKCSPRLVPKKFPTILNRTESKNDLIFELLPLRQT